MRPDHRQRLGELGEALACDHLQARGYAVIDRNFRTRDGELDVVAANDRSLVFCEVKSRVGRTRGIEPLASVGEVKRGQVRRMARRWLAERGAAAPKPPEMRFDAIGITLDRHGRLVELDHVEGAF